MPKAVRRCFKELEKAKGSYIVGKMCNKKGAAEKYADGKEETVIIRPTQRQLKMKKITKPQRATKKPASTKKPQQAEVIAPKKKRVPLQAKVIKAKPAPKPKKAKPAPKPKKAKPAPKPKTPAKAKPVKEKRPSIKMVSFPPAKAKPAPVLEKGSFKNIAEMNEAIKNKLHFTSLDKAFRERDGVTEGEDRDRRDSYGNERGRFVARPPEDYVFIKGLSFNRSTLKGNELEREFVSFNRQLAYLHGAIPIFGYRRDLHYANAMEKQEGTDASTKRLRAVKYKIQWIDEFNKFVKKTPLWKEGDGREFFIADRKKLERQLEKLTQ